MKAFEFTTASTEEIFKKLDFCISLNTKFKNLRILDFTNSLNKIFFVFQAYPKDFQAFKAKEYKIMRRKTKTLELYLILDYERIMQGTDPENLLHIKEVFLKGCETFLKPLKDFKYNEFETKIKELL